MENDILFEILPFEIVPFESLTASYQQKVLKHLDLIADESNSFWLYWVEADYRPKNPTKPTYYVVAKSERDAKIRFHRSPAYDHLKVYRAGKIDSFDKVREILMHPYQYNMLFLDDLKN